MDKLKKYFLKVHEHYIERRPFFLAVMEKWQKKGKLARYKQAKLLYDDAQSCEREILAIFEGDEWKNSRPYLKVKINTLDALCKELILLTKSWWRRATEILVVIVGIALLLRFFVFGFHHVMNTSADPTLLVGDRVWGDKITYMIKPPAVGDMVMFDDPLFNYDSQSSVKRFWQKNIGIPISVLGLGQGPELITKRIVAGPNDVIEGKIEQGMAVIYRNGKKINESYVNKYPLLGLKKDVGLVSVASWWGIPIPEWLKKHQKIVLYSYDPKKDFEEQPFYYIDYQNVLYNPETGYVKMYKPGLPSYDQDGSAVDEFGPFIIPEGKYWVMGDNRRDSIDSRMWRKVDRGFIDRASIQGRMRLVLFSVDSEEQFLLVELIKNPIRFWSMVRLNRFLKKIE